MLKVSLSGAYKMLCRLPGIAHLFDVYESSPNYTNEEGQMDVVDQLSAVRFTNTCTK